MKAEIDESGTLRVFAENKLESFALREWFIKNINGCTLQFKDEHPRCFWIDSRYPKVTLFRRMWLRIQLFFCR